MSALILAVDDDESNLQLLKDFCESSGWSIITERDGTGCLERAREVNPDLILLDMLMPETKGLELMAQLRKEPHLASVPVVFITAVTDPQAEEQALRMGATDYVRKPFRLADLQSRISTALEIKAFISGAKTSEEPTAATRAISELLGRARAGERFGCCVVLCRELDLLRAGSREEAALLLVELVRRLRGSIRGRDLLYLSEQGELLLLFPASDRDGVRIALERLSKNTTKVTIGKTERPVTLGFGYVTVPHGKTRAPQDVLTLAREAAVRAQSGAGPVVEAPDATE